MGVGKDIFGRVRFSLSNCTNNPTNSVRLIYVRRDGSRTKFSRRLSATRSQTAARGPTGTEPDAVRFSPLKPRRLSRKTPEDICQRSGKLRHAPARLRFSRFRGRGKLFRDTCDRFSAIVVLCPFYFLFLFRVGDKKYFPHSRFSGCNKPKKKKSKNINLVTYFCFILFFIVLRLVCASLFFFADRDTSVIYFLTQYRINLFGDVP